MLIIKCFEVSVFLLHESYSLYFKHITNQLLQILDDRASCSEANSTVLVLSFVGEIFSRICRRGLSGTYITLLYPLWCPKKVSVIFFSILWVVNYHGIACIHYLSTTLGSWENVDLILVTDMRKDVPQYLYFRTDGTL